MSRMGAFVLAAACTGMCVAGAGCILPVSTGAPLPATTVGRGNVGFALHSEVPTLDLIAEGDDQKSSDDPIKRGDAIAGSMTATLSVGIGEDTDLEAAAEGALYYFIVPMPTGGTVGIRHHVGANDVFDFAVAAKAGFVTSGEEASAKYGALQGALQIKRGFVRPLAALSLMPSRIHRQTSDGALDFNGFASSLTIGVMFTGAHVTVGPYASVTNFYSDQFDNSGYFVAAGLMLAARPDRNASPDL